MSSAFVVQGKAVDADSKPFSGGIIRAFDVNLRTESLLGTETTTDGEGRYTIRYEVSIRSEINLRVTAYDTYNKELSSSPVHYCAGDNETIDLIIERDAYHGPSEYEKLVAELIPLLRGSSLSLADLLEDDEHDDITFLSGKTKRPAEHIAFLSLAHRLQKETELEAEIYYGFFRQGLPTKLRNLLRQSPEVQRRALEAAVNENTIPLRFGGLLDEILLRLKELIVRKAVELPQEPTPTIKASLGQLLSTVLPKIINQEAFVSDYINHRGPISKFWEEIKSKPEFRDHVQNLEFTLQAATLTKNHLPLVQELQRMHRAGEIASLSDLVRFGEKDWQEIISRRRGDGSSTIIGFPSDIPGKDDDEKAANYTRVMARMVEDTSPTTFIARRIESENDGNIPGKQDLLTFLNANPKFDFKFGRLESYLAGKPDALNTVSDVEGTKTRIKAMQRLYKVAPHYDQMSVLRKGGLDSAHAVARMGENTFRGKYGDALGGSVAAKAIHGKALEVQAKAINLLAEHGLASYKVPMSALHDEAQKEVEGIPEWSTLFGSLDLCKCEHCRSVYSPAAYLVDLLHFLEDRPSKIEGKSAKNVLFERRPDIGEIELTCENTNTPLPYVDLVNEILENAVSPFPPFSPFILAPELEADLNNKTVSVALRNSFSPTISPEALISVGGRGEPWTLDEPWWSIDDHAFTYTVRKESIDHQLHVVSRSLQTKGSALERGANSQYVNTGAYDILRETVFPWRSLPFDLWGEEVRTYLGHLGVKRHEITETFLPGDREEILNDSVVTGEHLGITREETRLITGVTISQPGAAMPGVWNLWGFKAETLSFQNSIPDPSDSTRRIITGNWLDTISQRVDVFLQQSCLKYQELLDLLDTTFVNPLVDEVGGEGGGTGRVRAIQISTTDPNEPDTCEIAKLQLAGLNNQGTDTAHRIMRFIRLWRKLDGWTMRDLDRAITALRLSDPDPDLDNILISQLSHIQRLSARLKLSIVSILSFWAPIDTASYYVDHSSPSQPRVPSLYDQLFRNKAVSEALYPAFTENPGELSGTLTEHAAAISNLLKISTTDFHLLLGSSKVIPKSTPGGTEPDDRLSLGNLSSLYRHSILARALKIPIRDYISLLELAGIYEVDLASLPASFSFPSEVSSSIEFDSSARKLVASRFLPEEERTVLRSASSDPTYTAAIEALFSLQDDAITQQPFATTQDTVIFVENMDKVKASGFRISELDYLLRHNFATPFAIAPTEEAVALILDEIRAGLQRIATENTFNEDLESARNGITTDPTGNLTRQKLALLNWDNALIDQVLATLNGAVKYHAHLNTLPPGLDLRDLNDTGVSSQDDPGLQGKISYDQDNHKLEFAGIMTEIRLNRLKDGSADLQYRGAIDLLFDAPRKFISRYMRRLLVQNFSTELAALPAGVQFSKSFKNKVYFDAAAEPKQLHFLGTMTDYERDSLLGLSTDATYQAAVNDLFTEPDIEPIEEGNAFLTDADTLFMFDDTATPEKRFLRLLKRLLPHLQQSLSIDLVKQKMAKTLNLEHRLADKLLTRYVNSPAHSENKSITELVPAAPDFSAKSFAESNPNVKLTRDSFPDQFDTFTLLHKIATFIAKFEITKRQLVWIFEYGPSVGWLDLNKLPITPNQPSELASFGKWLRLFDLFRLRDRLPLGELLLDEIFKLARARAGTPSIDTEIPQRLNDNTGWDLTDLKFLVSAEGFNLVAGMFQDEGALVRLWDCFLLIKGLKMSAEQCRELAEAVVTPEGSRTVRESVRARYAGGDNAEGEAQWLTFAKPLRDLLREKQRTALVEYLVSHLEIPFPILEWPHPVLSLQSPRVERQAVKELQQKLNAVDTRPVLNADGIFGEETHSAVVSFQQANGILPDDGVVGTQTWTALDTVRHSPRDINDLYTHFFIDVEMNPCMMTSRIKQTLSSIQLFVQRSLMNLEESVAASAAVDERWLEWKWMKNYRVWEANHKVFLYPENWIEPELRDDKSPIFKELESQLLQGELTDEVAENALMSYLAKLDQVARLEIVGIYHQVEHDFYGRTPIDALHVFGRTLGVPHVYYYRQLVNSSRWTPWERVNVDFEGDQLVPLVWNGRLYVFWPTFMEKEKPSADPNIQEPDKYYEVKIAWSELQNKWLAKKISSAFLEFSDPKNYHPNDEGFRFEPSSFILRSQIDEQNNLYIILILPLRTEFDVLYKPNWTKAFKFNGCNTDPEKITDLSWQFNEFLTGTYFHGEFLREGGVYNLPEPRMLYLPSPHDSSALALTPGNFYLLPPHDGSKISYHTSFYMDNTRTFMLCPREVFVPKGKWWEAGEVDPSFVFNIPKMYYHELEPSYVGQFSRNSSNPPLIANHEDPVIRLTTMHTLDARAEVGDFSEVFEPYHKKNLYRFQTFYHPYVCAFFRELNRIGVDGLLQLKIQIEPQSFLPQLPSGEASTPLDFRKEYEPHTVPSPIVTEPYPVEDVDFEYSKAYALYNWELFFHIPLMIADRLGKNQRFEEAQMWFHRIFNPTDTTSPDTSIPKRYWRTKPFYNTTREDYQKQKIQNLLKLLAVGGDPVKRSQLSSQELATLQEFENSVDEWRENPFKPHLIARMRSTSYQKTVVMKYIDNLIAWGDQLFRRDTIESINEAMQLYIMAAEILGRKPEEVLPRAVPIVQTYNNLEPTLDKFSNALVLIEEFISPSGTGVTPSSSSNLGEQPPHVTLPTMLYFCVPKNDKLLGYWDIVADRLFKIRHCMNIQGVVRQLPLFEPPIDPALLVRAAAAGIDISSVLNDINPALPHYRFSVLAQKASELCSELKSLGAALLAALEKRDAEELALIRAEQETSLLKLIEAVKERQYDEAMQSLDALRKSRDVSVAKYTYYQKLFGVQEPKTPAVGENVVDIAPSPLASTREERSVRMIQHEIEELTSLESSNTEQTNAFDLDTIANVFHLIPNVEAGVPFLGKVIWGGQFLGNAVHMFADRARARSLEHSFKGTMASRTGQYIMRAHEWTLQSNLAAKEIMQIDKQIAAADIRKEIADQELSNHFRQIENARQVEDFMRSKYTNEELYSWMVGQISAIYFQSYQLAYDVAKRAEAAYRFELGLSESNFIQFGYWDSLKRGLLAGERLYHDLKRMEVAYLDQNQREYEITKHVSLSRLDPLALAQLKQTGECFVSVPEALFDLDYPGHYLRRIRYASLTVPCVTGPYVGVNCTLTLLRSSIRHSNNLLDDKYPRLQEEEDPRFRDSNGAIQSIVTSSGQNDSGLFETNLRDERYLPFEGSGAISEWQIQLPRDFRQFDYDTISDVVLHLRYTAREGGEPLRNQAVTDLQDALNEFLRTEGQKGLALPISLRHEFPSEWHRFLNPPQDSEGDPILTMNLGQERFPFIFQGRHITINEIELFLTVRPEFTSNHNESTLKLSLEAGTDASANPEPLRSWNGLLRATKSSTGGLGNWTLTGWQQESEDGTHNRIDPNAIENILLVCHYSL